MLKKLIVLSVAVVFLAAPYKALAEDTVVVCPQPYGGGVVCGVETHVPVKTGIADNLPLVGSSFMGASALLAYFSRKIKKIA